MECYIIKWPMPIGLENIIRFYEPQTVNEVEHYATFEEALERIKTYNLETTEVILKHEQSVKDLVIKIR